MIPVVNGESQVAFVCQYFVNVVEAWLAWCDEEAEELLDNLWLESRRGYGLDPLCLDVERELLREFEREWDLS